MGSHRGITVWTGALVVIIECAGGGALIGIRPWERYLSRLRLGIGKQDDVLAASCPVLFSYRSSTCSGHFFLKIFPYLLIIKSAYILWL